MKRTGSMIPAICLFLLAQAAQAQWTPAKRLTWSSGNSSVPAISIDSTDTIHVVWYDDTTGNAEIHYTNGK